MFVAHIPAADECHVVLLLYGALTLCDLTKKRGALTPCDLTRFSHRPSLIHTPFLFASPHGYSFGRATGCVSRRRSRARVFDRLFPVMRSDSAHCGMHVAAVTKVALKSDWLSQRAGFDSPKRAPARNRRIGLE